MPNLMATALRTEYLTNPMAIDDPQPRLSWILKASDPAIRGARQTAYRILVLDEHDHTMWDSRRVPSDETAHIHYAGKTLQSGERYHWKARVWDENDKPSEWSAFANWTMGPAAGAGWSHDQAGDAPRQAIAAAWIALPLGSWDEMKSPPATMLRKTFIIEPSATVRRAVLFASALGVYEARINGHRVGDQVLAPEWTDYRQKAQYQGYNVTAWLQSGENAIGAQISVGWYAGRLGMAEGFAGVWRGVYGRRLEWIAQLRIDLEDGRQLAVVSDSAWKATDSGPIRSADILDGEAYDARQELPGWDCPGFDDSAWVKAAVIPGPRLVAQPNEPIRVTRALTPIAVNEPTAGVYVYDLGQNMVGWPRVTLHGAPGTVVRIRYGEAINPDGTLYRDNLRGAPQIDTYTLGSRAEGAQTFEPHFTYHGFRFVEIAGLTYAPGLNDLTGCVFHSAAPEVGHFETSSPLLNKIDRAIGWTLRGNLHSAPTDCPQRDERLGWMGDAQVFSQTAIFNMDMAAFYTKWTRDIREAQARDGRFPDIAPHPYDPNQRFSGNPGWADAGVIVPWRQYVNYGDRDLLAEHFDAARRYVDWSAGNNPDLVWRNGAQLTPLWYGDWLNADTFADLTGIPRKGGEVPKEIYATAFFAYSTQLVAQMAAILGRESEATTYAALAKKIRAAFNKAFVAKNGRITGDTQAGYALALAFDLLPVKVRAAAAKRMVAALKPYDGALSTGIQSTVRMMNELTRHGYHQQAYALMTRTSIPSWGYMVEHGGTTIWERWDGWVEGRGFQDPGMNSFNHYAIGSVGEWMYRAIGGLNPDESQPGWKHFTVRPIPGGGLTWAQTSYDSIRGRITCRWEQTKGALLLSVDIPANTTATIYVPASRGDVVTESGQPVSRAPGVSAARRGDGSVCVEVAAGHYEFRSA